MLDPRDDETAWRYYVGAIAWWLMAALLVVAMAAAFAALAHGDEPTQVPAPKTLASLELPAPQTVKAGSGYVKLQTKMGGLLPVSWDVFAVFADPAVKLQWEPIADNAIVIGIPASPGAIRVVAAANTDPLKGPYLASTVITIEPVEGDVIAEAAAKPRAEPLPAGTKLHVTMIGGGGLTDTTRAALEKDGHRVWVFTEDDPRIKSRKLDGPLADAGGAPALIVQDLQGVVKLARKLPPSGKPGIVEIVQSLFAK